MAYAAQLSALTDELIRAVTKNKLDQKALLYPIDGYFYAAEELHRG